MAEQVKQPPVMKETQKTWVLSLGQEDILEKGMDTHSSIFIWRISWTEKPRATVHRTRKSTTQQSNQHVSSFYHLTNCLPSGFTL